MVQVAAPECDCEMYGPFHRGVCSFTRWALKDHDDFQSRPEEEWRKFLYRPTSIYGMLVHEITEIVD